LAEFTGERVIPGLVDADLLNEHLARYRFAAAFATGAVLDAGTGTGYGTAELNKAISVTGVDVSAEAISYAQEHFGRSGIRFVQAACEALPFADASFDFITAFEVIEHLDRWQELLNEANRALRPAGILLVSTPNKAYYAEMRKKTGPNPFHRHEFEHAEFETALYAVFPHVRIWAQNHAETIVFAPLNPTDATIEAQGDPRPDNAHFFLAACSRTSIEHNELFAWLPASGNVLRERERHIGRLEGELAQKDEWLEKLKSDHAALHKSHEISLAEVRDRSLWAEQRDRDVRQRDLRILELQEEAAERLAWAQELDSQIALARAEIERLQLEFEARTDWARSLETQLEVRTRHVVQQQREIEEYTAELIARRAEVAQAHERLHTLEAERALIAGSKWFRLGRALKFGPKLGPTL
jgi:SAM-dependent methyltransferase